MVTAVYIRSLAYSGTTWINMVLGGHERAFALGVPDRIWAKDPNDGGSLCSIHRDNCPFWLRFLADWDRQENAFVRIARLSGQDIILFNNINMNLLRQEAMRGDIDLKYVIVLRDGRANVVSALRHTPELFHNRYHAIQTWLRPAWENLFNDIPDDSDRTLVVKYESMVMDGYQELTRIGDFLGIDYSEDAFKFWEFDHHYIGGNTGTMGLLRDMRGIPRAQHEREDYYDKLASSVRKTPEKPVLDESWKSILTKDDRIAYDYLLGPLHEAMGYERDRIEERDLARFRSRYGLPEDSRDAPEDMDYPSEPVPRSNRPHAAPGLISQIRALLSR